MRTEKKNNILNWEQVASFWKENEDVLLGPRQALNTKVIDLCEPKPGDMILDFGTGIGEPGVTMALLHRDIKVYGVDNSQTMTHLSEQRAKNRSATNFRTLHMTDLNLPFSDCYFAKAISSFSLEFSQDTKASVKEIHRVLQPSGKLVMTSWIESSELNPFQSLIPFVLRDIGQLKKTAHDILFKFQDPKTTQSLFKSLNFEIVTHQTCHGYFFYKSIAHFWEIKKATAPAVQKDFSLFTAAQIQEIEGKINRVLQQQFASPNGEIKIPFAANVYMFEKI